MNCAANYRTIANVTLLDKLLKRIIALIDYLDGNDLLHAHQ